MKEGSSMAAVVGAMVVAIFALLVVALRPPLIVNVLGPSTETPEQAHVMAVNPTAGCGWNGTASYFYPRFGYVNIGNRTAYDAVANLTYTEGFGNATFTVLYLDVPMGEIGPHTSGYIELYETWLHWGVNVCERPFDFRITFTWTR